METLEALPVRVLRPSGTWGVAAGFLALQDGLTLLFTAAHTAQGHVPTTVFATWPQTMQVKLGATWVDIPLMSHGLPRFHYGRNADLTMADMMAFRLAPSAGLALSGAYVTFDMSSWRDGNAGDALVAHGYPNWVEINNPPAQSTLALTAVDSLINALPPVTTGYSGGPVLFDDGSLAGMAIGFDNGRTQVMRAYALAQLIHFPA